MSTRSHIVRVNADNSCDIIYCHYDGYVDGVGETLLNHYNTQEKVEELFNKGLDIKSLKENIEDTGFFENDDLSGWKNSFDEYLKKMDKNNHVISFLYFWKDNRWYCHTFFNCETYKDFKLAQKAYEKI